MINQGLTDFTGTHLNMFDNVVVQKFSNNNLLSNSSIISIND